MAVKKTAAKKKPARKSAPKPKIEVSAPEVPKVAWRPYQQRFISDPSRRRIWVKAAQIGGSTALAARSLARCINRPNHLVVMLSASERQAK